MKNNKTQLNFLPLLALNMFFASKPYSASHYHEYIKNVMNMNCSHMMEKFKVEVEGKNSQSHKELTHIKNNKN